MPTGEEKTSGVFFLFVNKRGKALSVNIGANPSEQPLVNKIDGIREKPLHEVLHTMCS